MFFSGEVCFAKTILVLLIFVSLLVILGFKSQLFTFIGFVFFQAICDRNPVIIDGGDQTLRLLLLMSTFLPIGSYFSLDSFFNKYPLNAVFEDENVEICSSVCLMVFLQISLIYISAAISKLNKHWIVDGNAVWSALHYNYFQTPFTHLLRENYLLAKMANYFTLFVEFLTPVFLLLQGWKIRFFIVISFILLHLGFAFCFDLGTFPLTSICLWLALIPKQLWFHLFKFLNVGKVDSVKTQINKSNSKSGGGFLVLKDSLNVFVMVFAFFWLLSGNLFMLSSRVDFYGDWVRNMPMPVVYLADFTGLSQDWRLFQSTASYQLWWGVVGHTNKKVQINLLTRKKIANLTKPKNFAEYFSGRSWMNYANRFTHAKSDIDLRGKQEMYSRYLCRTWNQSQPSASVKKVVFHFFREEIPRYPKEKVQESQIKCFIEYECPDSFRFGKNK